MKKIAFLFAGQGAQSAGMGKDLYENNAQAKALFDLGDKLRPGTRTMCFEGPGEELTLTENAQPCLFLTDLTFANTLREGGVTPCAVAGFSLGEIPALAFSNVLSTEDAYKLVILRGEQMSLCAKKHPGSMAAVLKLDNETVEKICSEFNEIWPVNYNCPGQLSCAGSLEELDAFCERVKTEGGRAVRLSVSGAFHTPYLKDASLSLKDALTQMEVSAPDITLYSDLSGEAYPVNSEVIINTISNQASSSVRFEKIIRTMAAEGIEVFVEVGPGQTLTGLVKKTLPEAVTYTVNDYASCLNAITELGKE